MHALFPKGTADFANDIEFLKAGDSALPFVGNNTLTSKNTIF
jgi:hypothetical protein